MISFDLQEHEEYTKKMFQWKRRMLKAQGDLQHEMRASDASISRLFQRPF